MNKLSHILVPIDFSNTSRIILEQGARMAAWDNATLHVLHAIDRTSLKHFEATHGAQDSTRIEGQARRLMTELLRQTELLGVPTDTSIVFGHPAECVLQRAREIDADLIVLSAHDTARKRLGRVAAEVVRHASCKVLLTRDWHSSKYRRIATCIDFSSLSSEAFQQAVHVARKDKAALELIHVIYPLDRDYYVYKLDFGPLGEEDYTARVQAELQEKLNKFTSAFHEELAGVDFKCVTLESTDPAVAITSYLKSSQIDLVALGTTGHESVFGLRFGSNAERLLHDTPCSVLSIKPSS